jgi:ribose transport system substrate-binding protein
MFDLHEPRELRLKRRTPFQLSHFAVNGTRATHHTSEVLMTTQTDVPATPSTPLRPRRVITPFRVLVTLILIGLLAWNLGLFKRQPRVAIITSGEGRYWDPVEAGANDAAKLYEVNLTVMRCKTDLMAQMDAIKQAQDENYDAIAISPINPDAQATVLAAVAAKITLVTLDSDSPVARRTCFVGTNNYDAGRLCGQMVRSAVPGGGEVIVILGNVDKENTQRRRQGVIDELLQRSYDGERNNDPFDGELKGTDFTILATLADGADPAVTTSLVADALKQHPNIKCFVGLLSRTGPAIVQGLQQAGKAGQVQVVGFDVSDETLAAIEAGQIFGTIKQDQYGTGFQAVHVLADCARGNTAELPIFGRKTLPCQIVKKENVPDVRQQLAGTPTTQPRSQ